MRRLLSLFAVGLLAVACGGIGAPGFTIPPINIPSLPPFELPSGITGGNGTCHFVTSAEIASIMGTAPQVVNEEDGDCTFVLSNLGTIGISAQANSDLASTKSSLGATARDITVGDLQGVAGTLPFINQPVVYVQRGDQQLQIVGVLLPADEATINKLVQIATVAVPRWQ